jgi:hypothetical protein
MKFLVAEKYTTLLALRGERPYENEKLSYSPEFGSVLDAIEFAG